MEHKFTTIADFKDINEVVLTRKYNSMKNFSDLEIELIVLRKHYMSFFKNENTNKTLLDYISNEIFSIRNTLKMVKEENIKTD